MNRWGMLNFVLVIRKAQVAALSAVTLQNFEDMILPHIAAEFPEKYKKLGDTKTRDLIRKGIEIGRQNGITQESAMVGLIELIVQFGAQFELSPEQAWARDLLAQKTVSGDVKVQLIAERFHQLTRGRRIEEGEDVGEQS
jgi:hypothetical protein